MTFRLVEIAHEWAENCPFPCQLVKFADEKRAKPLPAHPKTVKNGILRENPLFGGTKK